jgi:uncharacterized protein (TIGR02118 family)
MHLTFVTFNFQSADLEAEERNYLGHHVALARRFPGLRQYYTGRLMTIAGKSPEHCRGAILTFDDAAAETAAMKSDVIAPLIADTQAHLKDVASRTLEGEVIVPFEDRRAEQKCFVMAAAFDLEQSDGLAAAEKHYREHHVGIARRLPGLRNYMIGKLAARPGIENPHYRMAILVFDAIEAYRAAYRSPVGQELLKDETATIRSARVWRLDARVEV